VGRLPSENPVRRNSRVGPLVLPAEGRQGLAPNWPLPGGASSAEAGLWADLWATPQAVAWEHHGWTRVVARYVRCALAAEELEKNALAEARQLEDRLGLTPKAMRMLLWTIAADEVAEKREETSAGARGRIKAVG
jgi:hypothetical protein